MRRSVPVLVLLLAALVLPTKAVAQRCEAPPGTAAIDQYCETVPAVDGDRGSGDPSAPAPVAPETVEELNAAGADGRALAQALGHGSDGSPASDGGPGSGKNGSGGGAKPSGAGGTVPAAPSNNPLSAVPQAVGAGATSGAGLIVVLIFATLAMMGWGWLAFRRRSPTED